MRIAYIVLRAECVLRNAQYARRTTKREVIWFEDRC